MAYGNNNLMRHLMSDGNLIRTYIRHLLRASSNGPFAYKTPQHCNSAINAQAPNIVNT